MPVTLKDVHNLLQKQELFGTAVYAVANRGIFGFRVYTGIITGVRFTKDKPEFFVESTKESLWTTEITTSRDEVLDMIDVPTLHGVHSGAGKPSVNWPKQEE